MTAPFPGHASFHVRPAVPPPPPPPPPPPARPVGVAAGKQALTPPRPTRAQLYRQAQIEMEREARVAREERLKNDNVISLVGNTVCGGGDVPVRFVKDEKSREPLEGVPETSTKAAAFAKKTGGGGGLSPSSSFALKAAEAQRNAELVAARQRLYAKPCSHDEGIQTSSHTIQSKLKNTQHPGEVRVVVVRYACSSCRNPLFEHVMPSSTGGGDETESRHEIVVFDKDFYDVHKARIAEDVKGGKM